MSDIQEEIFKILDEETPRNSVYLTSIIMKLVINNLIERLELIVESSKGDFNYIKYYIKRLKELRDE